MVYGLYGSNGVLALNPAGEDSKTESEPVTTLNHNWVDQLVVIYIKRPKFVILCNVPVCLSQLKKNNLKKCMLLFIESDIWSNWNLWEACTAECGGGISSRHRNCEADPCMGVDSDVKTCNSNTCPGL